MEDKVNYIRHLNSVLDKMFEDDNISPHHISLYVAIFSMWNESGRREVITPSRSELCYRSKIGSNNTYHKAIKELHHWGYIIYKPSHSPLKASNITCIRFDTTTCIKNDTSTSTISGITADTTAATIYKRNKDNKEIYGSVIDYLNSKTGKKFSSDTDSTIKNINGRINEGYTLDDFKKVIDIKTNEWNNDPKMSKYLQPSTLFSPSKFEGYLNQSSIESQQPKNYL